MSSHDHGGTLFRLTAEVSRRRCSDTSVNIFGGASCAINPSVLRRKLKSVGPPEARADAYLI